ncbi:MAG: APC family permease [Paracoccaceae bacterium]|nr:APC family permease [Paracoccaceae bacterium]
MLYGLGVTIGAGIYVLIGEAVGRSGIYAPSAFLLSAVVMAFTAGSFAELSGRVPQAAGEAVYVDAAFGWPWLTRLVGLAVLVDAIIAAAAISLGSAGYLGEILPAPEPVLVTGIVLAMAAIACWGIGESIFIAGVMTVIEVLGLLAIIFFGILHDPASIARVPEVLPPLSDAAAMSGILSASLIAFFAFIGFDDVVNLVEETKDPRKIMPWAIGITLVIVTVLYFLVAFVAVQAIPMGELAASSAPVSLMFERLVGISPLAITLIAIMATMNGVVIILIMAARVTYGLARKGRIPSILGEVSRKTRTPVNATVLVAVAVLVLALLAPLDRLAETTSQIILTVFAMVNLALLRLKIGAVPPPQDVFVVPVVVPALGFLCCLGLLFGATLG